MDARNPSPAPFAGANRTPMRIGGVALLVRDIARAITFYRRTVGLEIMSAEGDTAILGADGVALLHLEHRPRAMPDDPRQAGLFHAAFLMPSRRDLADWYAHAKEAGLTVTRAGDHVVNEAIYYDDPDGNGMECYADRPARTWAWDEDGRIDIPILPFDPETLAREPGERKRPWRRPDGLAIGHINLRVGDLDRFEDFYCGVIGLDLTCRRDDMTFASSGRYHHHIAANIRSSRGAGRREEGRAGLAWFAIEVEDRARLRTVERRLRETGAILRALPRGFEAEDPWGLRVRLLAAT